MKTLSISSLLVCLILSSCTSSLRTIESGKLSGLALPALTWEQCQILDDTQGFGFASGFLCFGNRTLKKAKQKAMYNAIGNVPGADMLIAPRFEIDFVSVPLIYRSARVQVKAKAIRIRPSKITLND